MSSISCKECYDAIMLSERGGFLDDSMHYLSLHDDELSLFSVEESKEYMIESPRYNYLPDIKDEPWTPFDIRQTLRKVRFYQKFRWFVDIKSSLKQIFDILVYSVIFDGWPPNVVG